VLKQGCSLNLPEVHLRSFRLTAVNLCPLPSLIALENHTQFSGSGFFSVKTLKFIGAG
jgi:hypothetical protein